MTMPTHIVAAAGIVENDREEILLVKTHHGGWVFPGGQVEVGENVIDTVIREIKEESGINVIVRKLFAISSNTGINKGYDGVDIIPTKVVLDFICSFVDGELCISEENSETCWAPKDKVLDMITTPAFRKRYQAYLDYTGDIQYFDYVTQPQFDLKMDRKI